MKINNLILFLVAIVLLTVACVKKETVYPTYYFGQEYRDYVIYKPGSYWIYEKVGSGEIDSVYLYKQNRNIDYATSKINYNSESISEKKTSSLYGTLSFGGRLVSENGMGEYTNFPVSNYVLSNVDYFDGKINQTALEAPYTLYIEKRDSIQFTDKRFFEVKIFENMKEIYSSQPHKTYYAKHVGLVRKELFNGEVWNLIRYKVSQ